MPKVTKSLLVFFCWVTTLRIFASRLIEGLYRKGGASGLGENPFRAISFNVVAKDIAAESSVHDDLARSDAGFLGGGWGRGNTTQTNKCERRDETPGCFSLQEGGLLLCVFQAAVLLMMRSVRPVVAHWA
jgi:hypothetical protein